MLLGTLIEERTGPEFAHPLYQRALTIRENAVGLADSLTQTAARKTAMALDARGRGKEAKALRKKFRIQD
jgi:hypothetical protein